MSQSIIKITCQDNSDLVRVILVSAPDMIVAEKLAEALVDSRLAACCNLIAGVKSVYFWEGKTETSDEVLVVIKTLESLVEEVCKVISYEHPYDVPEILCLETSGVGEKYLYWLLGAVRQSLT